MIFLFFGDILDKVYFLKYKGGGEGVEKFINFVGDCFSVMYCVLNFLLEKYNWFNFCVVCLVKIVVLLVW